MTAVKWTIFVVAALASIPVGRWLRRHPQQELRAWTLVGFLPFVASLDMGLVSWHFPGDTHGLEFAALDWLALSLYLARRHRAGRTVPYRFALGFYALVAVVSVAQAQWALGAFGYVWKLGRMYLLYAAVARASQDEHVAAALLRGLTFGILYELPWVAYQHFGLHVHRASGTFAHENTLGMLVNLVVMAPIALVYAGRATKVTWLAAIAAVPICVFTVSRGTILFLGVGSVLVYLLSVLRRYDSRKALIGLAGVTLAVVLVPTALATLSSRSRIERDQSMQARRSYERAASMMLDEHPLGVGPNHFVIMVITRYGDRAGVEWSQVLAVVHNIYWLTAAEMGYAGVVALLALFLVPLLSAFRWSLRARRDRRADVLLGLGVGLTLFCVHSFFEWTWRITEVSYVYWMVVGMIAGLTQQLRGAEVRQRVLVRGRLALLRPRDLRTGGAAAFAPCLPATRA